LDYPSGLHISSEKNTRLTRQMSFRSFLAGLVLLVIIVSSLCAEHNQYVGQEKDGKPHGQGLF
jgi:hypothetical protein